MSRRWDCLVGSIALGLVVGCADRHGGSDAAGAATRAATLATRTDPTRALIDRFTEVDNTQYAVRTNILATPGNPTEGQRGLLPIGAPAPGASAPLGEAARLGAAAVPALLA